MLTRYQYKDTVWVDLNQPEAKEVEAVMNEFGISSSVANELTTPSPKSRAELHKKYIYLILQFPVFKHSHSDDIRQEIDFIIGPNFLITARYDTVDALEKFAKTVEVKSILEQNLPDDGTGALFFGIVREIYQSLFNELEYVEGWLSKIEKQIFAGREKEMVVALSDVSRTLLNFKKATDFHEEVLESLDIFGRQIFDAQFANRVRQVLDEYHKVHNVLKNNMESVTELRETNNALLTTKQNEIMKVLTIMAFVTFPLSLIATIFGMNTEYIPLVGQANDFWIVMGIMGGATLMMFAFFKHRNWL